MDGCNQFNFFGESSKTYVGHEKDIGSSDHAIDERALEIPEAKVQEFIGKPKKFHFHVRIFFCPAEIKERFFKRIKKRNNSYKL